MFDYVKNYAPALFTAIEPAFGNACRLLVLLMTFSTSAFASPYSVEYVDDTAFFGLGGSLALDSAGSPAIAYTPHDDELTFAQKVSGVWNIETLAGDSFQPSLQFDSLDRAKLSFYYIPLDGPGSLFYKAKTGLSWTTQLVDSGDRAGRFNALQLNSVGAPRIAYTAVPPDSAQLRYAFRDGGTWSIETVKSVYNPFSPGGGFFNVSLALDSAELPFICYHSALTSEEFMFAWKSGGVWTTEVVDPASAGGWGNSLLIDAAGNPHMSYLDYSSWDLKYATKSAGAWTIETVDSGPVSQGFVTQTSIGQDSDGTIRIAYQRGTGPDKHLYLATQVAGEWILTPVDLENGSGFDLSMRIDANGVPRFSDTGYFAAAGAVRYLEGNSLPNLTHSTPPNWAGPIVPRTSTDATPTYAPLPQVLEGNAPTTSFNFAALNDGFSSIVHHDAMLLVDDTPTWLLGGALVAPSHRATWMNTDVGVSESVVRGGRHHLRAVFDYSESNPESDETDNAFTDWFVWTPLPLQPSTPVVRAAPPVAYPIGAGPYPSCDGLRSAYTTASWTAVAVMPTTMTSEYDLFLHTPSLGSKDGFGPWIDWSYDGFPGNPDFMVVNYSYAPQTPYDFSVVNFEGYASDYVVEQKDADFLSFVNLGTQRLGPYSIGSQEIFDLYYFFVDASLVGVPFEFGVNNLSGGVDLESWIFDGSTPYLTKFAAIGGINANGPGGDEIAPPITFSYASMYALVVNKSKAYDMGLQSTYEIVISAPTSSVDAPATSGSGPLPTSFSLSPPRPNPFAASTTIELAVPADGGKATVAVYDLQGRRVAELAEGEARPGRHSLTWNGRDSEGREVAAGIYFVKLEAERVAETTKIVLLR